jgi:hypothetical protein
MPGSPANLEQFQCHPNQEPGVGLPLPRAIAVVSLATGCLFHFVYANYSGKGTGEISLLRNNLDIFRNGDIVVMDALYCSFATIALLKQRGVDVIVRMSGSRLLDDGDWACLDSGDGIITWKRHPSPKLPEGFTLDDFLETLDVRVIRYHVKNEEEQSETFVLVTTLLDESVFPKDEIVEVYHKRCNIETDIRTLKGTLSLDMVRCLTPDNVEREVWTTILGYNLVRRLAAAAAYVTDTKPREISFTGTWNRVSAGWSLRSGKSCVSDDVMQRTLKDIAKYRVGNRPGRLEPRVVRKRPKPLPKMKKARNEYHRRTQTTTIALEYF